MDLNFWLRILFPGVIERSVLAGRKVYIAGIAEQGHRTDLFPSFEEEFDAIALVFNLHGVVVSHLEEGAIAGLLSHESASSLEVDPNLPDDGDAYLVYRLIRENISFSMFDADGCEALVDTWVTGDPHGGNHVEG